MVAGKTAQGAAPLWVRTVLLAVALALVPPSVARAADLIVWWEQSFYPEEDAALREVVAAFEQKTGKQVELVQHSQNDMSAKVLAALAAGHPPDFLFGTLTNFYYGRWAYEGRLADLTGALGPEAAQFDQDVLTHVTLLNAMTGKRGLYALPTGRATNHVHVWKSLLERAGFRLEDIPKEWEPFWSFWCDQVQPAVRTATSRDDIWGVSLAMSVEADDTFIQFRQFVDAYEADYVTRDGRLVIDEPAVRAGLIKALDSYTAIWRKGCTPSAAADWEDGTGNNKAFLSQTVVMTQNTSLSIPNALRATRPEDYYKNMVTIDWPTGAYGQPLAITSRSLEAAVFRDGGHEEVAKEFVRFLVKDGWLAHWLDFAGDRLLPPMPELLEQPFWLNPGDPHRMRSAIQFLTRLRDYDYAVVSGKWRHRLVEQEHVWPKAIHRIATEGLTPEQAADEAIARIKQILSE
jgi:multiple sugar transport system substrate-binding protein